MMKKNKPINMATGGLMNMPPFIKKSEEEKEQGITPYDVNTPKEARQGLPSRLVAPSRTRFTIGGGADASKFPDKDGSGDVTMKDVLIAKGVIDADGNKISKRQTAYGGGIMKRPTYKHGGFHSVEEVNKFLNDPDNADEIKKMKEDISTENFKNFLLQKSKEKFMNEQEPKKKKAKTIAVAGGGLLRQKYAVGDEVLDEDAFDEFDIEDLKPKQIDDSSQAKSLKDKLLEKNIKKLENQKEIFLDIDPAKSKEIERQIQELKNKMSSKKAATGGLMKMSIGGQAGLGEKYDRRRDYQAYAEGDMVEDESLMTPTGMNTEDMDGIAEANMEMEAEDDMDMGDMDGVVDTSALSEEEEKVVDDAVEMFPELEAIIPKITAREFTEDELVEGPGTGTSDSIPALLSDGEFVFTAKSVKQIGVDKLRKQMKQAEEEYDRAMNVQEANQTTTASEPMMARGGLMSTSTI